jgi:hypothetical protein
MKMLTLCKAFPLVFGNNHGFNLWQTGLTFLGLFVGNVIGVSCDPFWRRNCKRCPQRAIKLLNQGSQTDAEQTIDSYTTTAEYQSLNSVCPLPSRT